MIFCRRWRAGQVDMVLSGMTMTPGRNLKVAFVGPYFASGKSILAKMVNVESVDEIAKMNNPDKVLVALKGSTSQMFVEKVIPKAKLVLADDYDQAVAMVRNDKAVAMVADYPICMVSVYRYPDARLAHAGEAHFVRTYRRCTAPERSLAGQLGPELPQRP